MYLNGLENLSSKQKAVGSSPATRTERKQSMSSGILRRKQVGGSDNFETPAYAFDLLLPYLKKDWVIWEPAVGKGRLERAMCSRGFTVTATAEDFLVKRAYFYFDVIITNPPYSLKNGFLEKCYEYKKPFALLLPLTALETKRRQFLYTQYGLEMIIPDGRIDFGTPSGKKSSAWFATAWFTWGLDIGRQLNFVHMDKWTERD